MTLYYIDLCGSDTQLLVRGLAQTLGLAQASKSGYQQHPCEFVLQRIVRNVNAGQSSFKSIQCNRIGSLIN